MSLRFAAPAGITVRLGPDDLVDGLRAAVVAGLSSTPKTLPAVYLYDARGSELFDQITRVAEYYPTRAERQILGTYSADIAAASQAEVLAELGSGTCEKSRILIRALIDEASLTTYVPFDVSEGTLRDAAGAIVEEFPDLAVHGIVGDFRVDLDAIPAGRRRMIAFLGCTIGNCTPGERADFLAGVVDVMNPGDSLLLGVDLVKDPDRLVAAYDDASGVTAEFNKNVLVMLNRELGADFAIDRFDHVAHWDPVNEWIEMRLKSRGAQTVRVTALGLSVEFADGEELRTEISAKFRVERVRDELVDAGLEMVGWWTDAAGDCALSLGMRR
ncbi:MAG: L-histidine N(alpha)-methyltransferase [Actinobacteria bacterium]|nr:L-histidine N(alpha)-methyltransferase [Actinomycetota bacterium]